MTREELKEHCKRQILEFERIKEIMPVTHNGFKHYEEHKLILELLEQQPCDDCISRQAVDELSKQLVHTTRDKADFLCNFWEELQKLTPVTPKEKTGHCKDCKWWKDSDGAFRRGIGAESKCPINCKKVYEGNGYCFMFEPQESEEI